MLRQAVCLISVGNQMQVKEHMLLAVQNQLAFASEKGILDTAALFFVKDSCDKLLDPRYDSADYDESKLCDWYSSDF